MKNFLPTTRQKQPAFTDFPQPERDRPPPSETNIAHKAAPVFKTFRSEAFLEQNLQKYFQQRQLFSLIFKICTTCNKIEQAIKRHHLGRKITSKAILGSRSFFLPWYLL